MIFKPTQYVSSLIAMLKNTENPMHHTFPI